MSESVTKLAKCEKCAAQASRHDARFCEYCGAELPKIVAQPQPIVVQPGGAALGLEERFRALKAHPDWERLKVYLPEDAGKASVAAVGFSGFFLVIWIAAGGFITTMFAAVGGGAFALIPMGIVGLGLVMMLSGAAKYHKFRNAPVLPIEALVVDERVQVSGGGENSRARTSYFTTLEFEGGKRTEHHTIDSAASEACPGDVGMAYLRDNRLVCFKRVSV